MTAMVVDGRRRFLQRRAALFVTQTLEHEDFGVYALDRLRATLSPTYYRAMEKEIIQAFDEQGIHVDSIDLFSGVD